MKIKARSVFVKDKSNMRKRGHFEKVYWVSDIDPIFAELETHRDNLDKLVTRLNDENSRQTLRIVEKNKTITKLEAEKEKYKKALEEIAFEKFQSVPDINRVCFLADQALKEE